jgi:hypothetical protein
MMSSWFVMLNEVKHLAAAALSFGQWVILQIARESWQDGYDRTQKS